MKEKWLNIWKVNYNGNGYGATPVYFDNLEAAQEFAKRDHADKPVRVKASAHGDVSITVYSSADDYDNVTYENPITGYSMYI